MFMIACTSKESHKRKKGRGARITKKNEETPCGNVEARPST